MLVDGKQVVVPPKQLDDISPSGPERKLVTDAIVALELWAPDYERRLSALQKAGSNANPKLIPGLGGGRQIGFPGKDSPHRAGKHRHHSAVRRRHEARRSPGGGQGSGRDAQLRGGASIQDLLEHMARDAKEGKPVDADLRA